MDLLSDIIETPKLSPIKYRISAALIDFLILFAIGWGLGLLFGEHDPNEYSVGFELNGWPALAWFTISFCLISVQEGLTGKTIGKRVVGIRVVSESSIEPSVSASIIRHLFDFVDLFFFMGLMVAASNEKKQRVGDKIAKTLVILSNPRKG